MLAMVLLNSMSMKRKQAARKRSVKSVIIEKKADVEYCRTCLNTDDLVSIFYSAETKDKRTEDLRLVTGLEISMNDGLSQKICSQCVETMNLALQFRRVSKKAEKALLSMLTDSTKTKRKSMKLQKVLKSPKRKSVTAISMDYKKEEEIEVEKQLEDSFNYDEVYAGDDFQNDTEYAMQEQEPESQVKVKSRRGRQRAPYIPTAASYKCNTCNKEFRMKATYKAHMRFHTNYCVCEACGKRCRNNNQLQEHKRARHGLGKIHTCAYCEYSSATKEALTIHERRHTGERPYICDHCGASFHRRSNLVQHIAIHLPDKNFQCPLCPKREKSHKLLTIHQYKAHRQSKYRYLCAVCGASFSRPGNVRQHLARSHRLARHTQPAVARVEIQVASSQEQDLAVDNYLFIDNATL